MISEQSPSCAGPTLSYLARSHIVRALTLTLLAAVAMFPTVARAQFSGFASSAEGWTIVSFTDLSANNYAIIGTYAPTYVAGGGNPGGYIFTNDPDGGDLTFSAPAPFLGNHSAAFGTTFSYDLTYASPVNYHTTDLVLEGGGIRLLWRATPDLTPNSSWTTVNVLLAPAAQWRVTNTAGTVPTVADFNTVLGNLTGIYIRGEFAFGADTPGLDNVQFSLVPEPATYALLATGLAAIGCVTLRRNRRGAGA